MCRRASSGFRSVGPRAKKLCRFSALASSVCVSSSFACLLCLPCAARRRLGQTGIAIPLTRSVLTNWVTPPDRHAQCSFGRGQDDSAKNACMRRTSRCVLRQSFAGNTKRFSYLSHPLSSHPLSLPPVFTPSRFVTATLSMPACIESEGQHKEWERAARGKQLRETYRLPRPQPPRRRRRAW